MRLLKKTVLRQEFDGPHPYHHYLVVEDRTKPATWYLRIRKANGKLDRVAIKACWEALHEGTTSSRIKYHGPGRDKAIQKLKEIMEQSNENHQLSK